MGTIGNPPKLYIDFPGYAMGLDAANSTDERVVNNGLGQVQRIRMGMPKKFPDTTRIVLDLKSPLSGVMQPLPDKTLFAMVLFAGGKNPPPLPPSGPGLASLNENLRGLTIVVDAGHGGHDSGARGKSSHEKSHCLDIARRVRNYLDKRGATVLMTRDGDYFVPLQGRVDFANQRKADLFVSVHINASVRKTSTGTQTFFWTAQSLPLAREVHKELVKATGLPNRKISQARFFVIRKTWMPSILTESAFISNPKEEKLVMNANWRDRVARGIAQGIANYAVLYLRHGVSS
ncbi:MAG TPA: N-acetylmuramoyl-L-alanine amidase, partial [Abditibacteriaceae bacterium]|nr:N-acetylmuramoyl-L-alanine amidase [Abditibacteriaceae bacterium]